jgi:hypothetical protein
MATQAQIAAQMVAQLRILDPSVSAEVGTPERKIIDTVAQALAEASVDLNLISGGLDIDSKFGSDLDNMLGIFGFGRQQGTRSQGFITFSRTTPVSYDIPIARGTQVTASNVVVNGQSVGDITYVTTEGVFLRANQLTVIAPIQALLVGSAGNVAAGSITSFAGQPILGITSVNNSVATLSGTDQETDEELKVRFKNTVFRNLAGTSDQYLALAVSTANTTKANVVGPISRYREYLQVPDVDDATADPDSGVSGNGSGGEYTTALSTIPYSKYTYASTPYYISTGNGSDQIFYREALDFRLNTTSPAKDAGDTYRGHITGSGLNPLSDLNATYQPNVTFVNVYSGADESVQAVRPKDVLLFEHSYMSSASRNDITRNITNCVDLFVNGENATLATNVVPVPNKTFSLTGTYAITSYQRSGEPGHTPIVNNVFSPLYWQPTIDLPDTIVVSGTTYYNGIHYWLVEDITSNRGTVRARNGIEWAVGIKGVASGDNPNALPGTWTGPVITGTPATAISIEDFTYDKNIIDLQAAIEGGKQITTDALAHRSKVRYFKLDLTVMYNTSATASDANQSILDLLTDFFDGQYFGTTIQLSDILQVVHNASGVDNVRWSREILEAQKNAGLISTITDVTGNPRHRIVETDVDGNPLEHVIIERKVAGNGSTPEVWQFYFPTTPDSGSTYKLIYNGTTTSSNIASTANAAAIQTVLTSAPFSLPVTVAGSGTATTPFVITFTANGSRNNFTADSTGLSSSVTNFDTDFFLRDDELPSLALGSVSGGHPTRAHPPPARSEHLGTTLMANTFSLPTFTDSVDLRWFIEPLGGSTNPRNYLDSFPDELYSKSPDSHFVKFMYALLGPAGIGTYKQSVLNARLALEAHGFETFDLEAFYSDPFRFGRILNEIYDEDPTGLFPRDIWDQIKAKDESYRTRAITSSTVRAWVDLLMASS